MADELTIYLNVDSKAMKIDIAKSQDGATHVLSVTKGEPIDNAGHFDYILTVKKADGSNPKEIGTIRGGDRSNESATLDDLFKNLDGVGTKEKYNLLGVLNTFCADIWNNLSNYLVKPTGAFIDDRYPAPKLALSRPKDSPVDQKSHMLT